MIFITDELGKFEKNIIELAENMGFKECKTIEAIDLFCGISEKNDVLKEKDRYYAFIDIPQYWSVRADGLNGAIYDNKTKKANIYFKNPIEKRMVSRVEWIDRNNTVYRIDYYNKYGYMYCSENVSGGNVTVREFYDRNGDIKVLEQTGPKTYRGCICVLCCHYVRFLYRNRPYCDFVCQYHSHNKKNQRDRIQAPEGRK